MLALVGVGLRDGDVSVAGAEFVKKAAFVLAERYTSPVDDTIFELGVEVELLERADLEERAADIIELARANDVAILVPGDPLVATTHVSILLEAEKAKVPVEVFHASSVLTAVAETGLQCYKFGRTVSLPWEAKESAYQYVKDNLSLGLHTLVLLDVSPAMKVTDAVRKLWELEELRGEGFFAGNTPLLACSQLGTPQRKMVYARMDKLSDFGAPPYCLIVPGELHFLEEEALRRWHVEQGSQ